MIQSAYTGADCQRWYIDQLPHYRIQVKRGGRSLDVDTCTNTLRADARVWIYW